MPKPPVNDGKTRVKTAEDIYKAQNRWLHKAMAMAGQPYRENKEFWTAVWSQMAGRTVEGLSELTLGERDLVLNHFQVRYPGAEILNPAVPNVLKGWKKGDPAAGYEQRVESDRQVKYILALWAALGYTPDTIRTMVKSRYGADDVRFLNDRQKKACIGYLTARAKAAGKPVKYYG